MRIWAGEKAQGLKICPEDLNSPTSILCALFSWLKINSSSKGHYTFDLPGHCTHMCKSYHLPHLCNLKIKIIKKSKCENNYNKVSPGACFRGEAYTGSLVQFSHLNITAIQEEGSSVTQKSIEARWYVTPRSRLKLDDMWPPCLVPSTSSANTWPAAMTQCTSHQAWWPELYPQNHMVDGSLQSAL